MDIFKLCQGNVMDCARELFGLIIQHMLELPNIMERVFVNFSRDSKVGAIPLDNFKSPKTIPSGHSLKLMCDYSHSIMNFIRVSSLSDQVSPALASMVGILKIIRPSNIEQFCKEVSHDLIALQSKVCFFAPV